MIWAYLTLISGTQSSVFSLAEIPINRRVGKYVSIQLFCTRERSLSSSILDNETIITYSQLTSGSPWPEVRLCQSLSESKEMLLCRSLLSLPFPPSTPPEHPARNLKTNIVDQIVCPQCSNVLTVASETLDSKNRLACQTCPFTYLMTRPIVERKNFTTKEVDAQLGGEDEFKSADKTKIQCPNNDCNGMEAIYYSVQIRSADEPETHFYKVS